VESTEASAADGFVADPFAPSAVTGMAIARAASDTNARSAGALSFSR
jgi:hypothetical protein